MNTTPLSNARLALAGSPAPRILDTRAVPPVPSMKPMPPRIITKGITRFTEAKAVLPTKLDTNRPSTTPLMEVSTFMTMVGSVMRSSLE